MAWPSWIVKPKNPSPVQPLSSLEFMVMPINVGGPAIEPKRQQTITLYDRNMNIPSLGEVYTTKGDKWGA